MARYGWIVTVERCSYMDSGDARIFNVNLARPWSDAEVLGDIRGPKLPNASQQLLLYPWEWNYQAAGWRYFGNIAPTGSPPVWRALMGTPVKGVTQPLNDCDVLRKAIKNEIAATGANCEYPFSQGLEDFWATERRSYVHTLAPLTHWPALTSETLLGLSFFVSIDAAALAGIKELACFPEFDIDAPPAIASKSLRLLTPNALAPNENPITQDKKVEVVASYNDAAVAFLGLAGMVEQDEYRPADPQLSQGLASRSSVRSAVWDYLLPAQILRRWLETNTEASTEVLKNAAVRKSMPKLLWEALGTGNEASSRGIVNLLEFLLDAKDGALARKLRKDLQSIVLAEDAAITALYEAAKTLAKPRTATGDKVWSVADIDRWKQRINDFETMKEALGSTGEKFKKAWLTVSEAVLSDEQVSELYGSWLAFALADQLSATLGGDWDKFKSKLLTYGEVRSDHWIRGRTGGISTGQWEAAEQLVVGLNAEKPKAEISDAELKPLVNETMNNIKARLRDSAGSNIAFDLLVQNGLQAFVTSRAKDWHAFMTKSVQRLRRRPRDRGLRLDFSNLVSNQQTQIQVIRGYAIALCAGTHTSTKQWTPDRNRAAWLTDTALYFDNGKGKWDWLKSGADTAWMHETVGATFNDGELLLSVEYEGIPLATTLSDDHDGVSYETQEPDEDGFKTVVFSWRRPPRDFQLLGRDLPLLGYGLLYKAVATPLDNAGGVLDKDLRSKSALAELQPARDLKSMDSSKGAFPYRSSEPPGAPSLLAVPNADYYELSEETQAHAWQNHMGTDKPMKVALLAFPQEEGGQKLFPKALASCRMDVVPPTTHFAFIERWINTDRVLIEQKQRAEVSDSNLAKFSSIELAAFIERFREVKETVFPLMEKPRYHPAVTAIGIEAWSPRSGSQFLHIAFERLVAGTLEPNQFRFAFEVQAAPASNRLNLKPVGSGIQLSLPQGEFVLIRLFSLVDNKYFEEKSDTNGRFVNGIQLDMPKDFNGFPNFKMFGPTEYWFETIPEWNPALIDKPVTVHLTAPSEKPIDIVSPNLLTARIDFHIDPWAPWVKGVYAQRHEWHWTGYPVDFPRIDANLNAWLPSLAGVESFREVVNSQLTSSFDAKNAWMIGPDADNVEFFFSQKLPAGRRTSRYAALFVRPIVRFRRWLDPMLFDKGPAMLETLIWADGKIVLGRGQPGENSRLPMPVLRHSIPLTSTFGSTTPPKREANGVALIFDEAIRRTDDVANVGGLGDVLELDLLETRFSKFKEMGNNPIMHGVAGQWTDKDPLSLTAKPPVGLTFDIGANAKVAQTAMVVQPLNGGGNWLLAKARVRRMVLPETELGSLITRLKPPDGADVSMDWYKLLNRLQGDEAVIPDIAIDVSPTTALKVKFEIGTAAFPHPLEVTIPNRTEGDIRYVLSWHKGRWGTALPSWRCQVLAQIRDSDKLTWRVIDKISCHQNTTAELPRGFKEPTAYVGLSLQADVEVRKIRLSDYTDPVWLTFIGSFGEENLGSNTDFVFDSTSGELQLLRTVEGSNATAPLLRGLDESLTDPTQPLFHLVLVFRPTDDLTRGHSRPGSGMMVGAYWKRRKIFTYLPNAAGEVPSDLEGCHAQVIAMQRITALSANEIIALEGIVTLPGLLEMAFPHQDKMIQESLIRFLPEYLGPIPILVKTP